MTEVPEKKIHDLREFQLRAKLPLLIRYAALAVIVITVVAVLVGFYRERNKTGFRLKSEHAQLSPDVIAEVNGYERLETDGNLSKYYIKAAFARTFADNHQELRDVYLETFDEKGEKADTMTAQEVLYVPEADKNFTAYMKGDVKIESRDRLKVNTPNIVYTKSNETAEADQLIEFERDNVRGKSFGATVKLGEKRIDLLRDVEIETFESAELAASGVRYAKINSVSASFDQLNGQITLNDNVKIHIDSRSKTTGKDVRTDVAAQKAVVYFAADDKAAAVTPERPAGFAPESAQLKKFELFESVHITSIDGGASPTNIDAGYALFDKAADRYELKNAVHIVTSAADKPTDIRGDSAVYEQSALKVSIDGSGEITQGSDYLKGNSINADLFPDKKLKYAVLRGDALIRQSADARTTSVSGPELNALFGDTRQLQAANAVGASTAEMIPNSDPQYSRVTMTAPRAMHLTFAGPGLLRQLTTEGRTTIQLNAVNSSTDSANKRVTADAVKTVFDDNGKDIKRAEAVGNAELFVDPLRAAAENYRTTVTAPRFDCEFYAGNNAKLCVGGKKAKAVRVPTVATDGRGEQTLTADSLNAAFSETSKDIERFDAVGSTKFVELDRTAIASQMSYTTADTTVRLRGGDPTAWDSRSRVKAREIDWNTSAKRTNMRGAVSTTYYTRRTMGDALPFGSSDKPVFVTSDSAEFDHAAETAAFAGNARGWQDDNYVRADRLFIRQSQGNFQADGNVQSVMFDVKQKQKGRESSQPVYAASNKLNYDKQTRLVQYRENVDIRQGTDRITAASADIFLNEQNELSRTVAETGVVITQPGRKATGNWVQYSTADEIAVLRGAPATINDSANGSSQAAELTFMMRENRVISEGKSKPSGTGRIRSVYNVKPN
ncbi:MAG: LPS export ABC transporter periplasmic protein LptC [Chloracidobacterium sp.]|nr:LPS export ABC transporter periplasmic protein LptC [Chloracidobacterium sp.]MBP9935951.1 LPS export ABC transporter periplasmic protein LptC [Pyrinomonadaceae bacterium]